MSSIDTAVHGTPLHWFRGLWSEVDLPVLASWLLGYCSPSHSCLHFYTLPWRWIFLLYLTANTWHYCFMLLKFIVCAAIIAVLYASQVGWLQSFALGEKEYWKVVAMLNKTNKQTTTFVSWLPANNNSCVLTLCSFACSLCSRRYSSFGQSSGCLYQQMTLSMSGISAGGWTEMWVLVNDLSPCCSMSLTMGH